MWQAGTIQALGSLGGSGGVALDINNAGWVVGEGDTLGGDSHAFLWHGGQMQDLNGISSLSAGFVLDSAQAVNDAGQVVGTLDLPGGACHPFFWDGGAAQDLGTLWGNAGANDVNNLGQVVGWSQVSGLPGDLHAFLWQNETLCDLNDLIPAGLGTITEAYGINDAGQIVADMYMHSDKRDYPVLLTPVPEPATLAMGFAAISILMGVRARW